MTIASGILATISATAILAALCTDARAQTAPKWCAMSNSGMGTQSCTFATLDQCRAFVALAGYCQPNPTYAAPAASASPVAAGSPRSPRTGPREF